MAAGISAELLGKHLVQTFGIEADHHLAVHNNGGRGAAVVLADQLEDCLLVYTYVLHFKLDTFLRKVALRPGARGAPGLAIDHHTLSLHSFPSLCRQILAALQRFIFFGSLVRPGGPSGFPW